MTEFGISIEPSKANGGDQTGSKEKNLSSLLPPLATELHEACRNFDSALLKRLLEEGADPNVRDGDGRAPIHVLLEDGFLGHLNEPKLLECLEILLECRQCDVNVRSVDPLTGETPLSLSVQNKFEPCALLLVRRGAETSVRTRRYRRNHSLATKITTSMPKVMEAILDSGVNLEYSNNQVPIVKLDWRPILQYPSEKILCKKGKDMMSRMNHKRHLQRETSFLYSMLDASPSIREKYLRHPLVNAFLHIRIVKTKRSLFLFQIFMWIFPLLYMIFMNFLYFDRCKFVAPPDDDEGDEETILAATTSPTTPPSPSTPPSIFSYDQKCEITLSISIPGYLLSIVWLGITLTELLMFFRIDFKYWKSWRAWVLRASIVTMGFTLWPALQFNTLYNITWQYPIAALGIFFAWIMFLVQMELIPQVKIYLEMLASIILSVMKIILLFLPLFLGFFMGFKLIFFRLDSVMSFILMTVDIGSNEYEDMIGSPKDRREWFRTIADIFNVAFIIVISIVFMNFLLGASISDIQELKRNAVIMNLSHRVQNVFLINLLFPYRYNVVGKEDIKRGNWYYSYIANERRRGNSSKGSGLPKYIQVQIAILLKTRSRTEKLRLFQTGSEGNKLLPITDADILMDDEEDENNED